MYIYGTYAWTPNNVFWAMTVVGSLLCKFKSRLFITGDPLRITSYRWPRTCQL